MLLRGSWESVKWVTVMVSSAAILIREFQDAYSLRASPDSIATVNS